LGGTETLVSIEVTWLGHSTVVVEVDGVRLVADPLLRPHAGILRRRGPAPSPEKWRDVDAVLLSHLHLDHADVASLRLLPEVPVLTAPENARWVSRQGLEAMPASATTWSRVGAVEVMLAPAVHTARPMPHRPNAANGHLVRGPSGIVWIAGDTALFPGMAVLPQLAEGRIDLAIVPIGGWGPRLSPGHLDPEQAAEACRLTGARAALPVHWKTLHLPAAGNLPQGWMDAPGPAFEKALSPSCQSVVLEPGDRALV
jgi:L-ascorbate metabolism protein UlaG (beta-lactamase superfamily)